MQDIKVIVYTLLFLLLDLASKQGIFMVGPMEIDIATLHTKHLKISRNPSELRVYFWDYS